MSSTITPSRRAAIYIRVSTDRQEEGTSLESQEERCRQYAVANGYGVQKVYREVHTGAELWERPEMRALLESIRRREVDAVVAYALDRLSRKQVHTAIIVDECERAGVALLFVTEEFEKSAVGEFIRSAKAFAAELEREKIKERMMRGKESRARAGKLLGGHRALYGYRFRDAERSAYDIDPLTGPVVKRIFAAALAGSGTRQIAHQLTRDRIPTAAGSERWSSGMIGRILTHPSYTGEARAYRHKTAVRKNATNVRMVLRPEEEQIRLPAGTIPPLIDRATFEAVQERLKRNAAESIRSSRAPEKFLLRAGFVYCGYCGRRVASVACRQKAGAAPRYRYVTVQCRPGTGGCGTSCSIESSVLDAAVWERVESILLRPEIIAEELRRLRSSDDPATDLSAMERLRDEIARKQTNLSRRVALIDDDEAAAPLLAEIKALAKQRQQVEAELHGLRLVREQWEATQAQIDNTLAWCRSLGANLRNATYAQKRDALIWLGVKVKLYQAGHTPRYEITADIPLDIEGDSGAPESGASAGHPAAQSLRPSDRCRWGSTRSPRAATPASSCPPTRSSGAGPTPR